MCGYFSDFTMDETIEGIRKNIEPCPSDSSSSDVVQFKKPHTGGVEMPSGGTALPTMDKFVSQHWRKKVK